MSGANKKPKDNPESFIFCLWLNNRDYVTLRYILALAGDLIYTSDKIKNLPGLLEHGNFIASIFKQADQFRDARDFFIHIDDVLSDPSKHGISGPTTLECGVPFTTNTKNNVYVLWEDIALYFSWENKQRKIVIDRPVLMKYSIRLDGCMQRS